MSHSRNHSLFLWAVVGTSCILTTGCVSKEPAPEEIIVDVHYRATDDVASRFSATDARTSPDAQAGSRGMRSMKDVPKSGRTLGRDLAPTDAGALSRLREELLATSVEGRKETQLVALGLAAYERGDFATALTHTRAAWLSLQQTRSRTLDEDLGTSPVREVALAFASALVASSESKEGIVLLERIAVASPRWLPVYSALFEHYMNVRAHDLAERVARGALSFTSGQGADANVLVARSLRAQGKRKETLDVLERARVAFPSDARVVLWFSLAQHDAGFLTEACEGFSLAYARMPGNQDAAYNHGLCLADARRWEEARSVVKLALVQHPHSDSLRLLAGNVLRRGGRNAEAYGVWKEFLSSSAPADPRRAAVENALDDLRQSGDSLLPALSQ